jgi:hypothetical protein
VPVASPGDVIAGNHLMLVVAADGLYEFDYTDPSHVKALGNLPVINSGL